LASFGTSTTPPYQTHGSPEYAMDGCLGIRYPARGVGMNMGIVDGEAIATIFIVRSYTTRLAKVG
jgi:hypothetical protein